MHPYVAALGLSVVLVLAGTALMTTAASPDEEPAYETQMEAASGGDGEAHATGAHEWEGGTGTTPTRLEAPGRLDSISSIEIGSDDAFTPANGVRGGSGTLDDPYVISGWSVGVIYIHDTTKAFEIKENFVSKILILDWTGQGGYVHHNYLANMRTNRNVERVGDPTAAVFENNTILQVEELRHFDGVMRNNTIGQPDPVLRLLQPDVVLNIAGLNGAGIHDNAIFGGVDMKIHGHHHSDAAGEHSHNHGQPDAVQDEDHDEDHQVRYVDFEFYRNTITDDGFGLRYNDLDHAGDDRLATSEQEPDLEKPHTHYTRIALVDNVIDGATLRLATVNALDERHVGGERAVVEVRGNRIVEPLAGDGLVLQDVTNAFVDIRDNEVGRGDLPLSGTSAIFLTRFHNSTVSVGGNQLGAYKYGVRASQFSNTTTWSVRDNDAPGVEFPVYWDDTVANAPEGEREEQQAHVHDEAAAPASLTRLRLG